ncbi:MAG: 4-hydroxy-tetrahydrodipicolinate reductase [Steroidobacteraceae bacterium]
MPGVAVFGVSGRMGQSLVRALQEGTCALRLSGALASPTSERLGQDAAIGGAAARVTVTADLKAALTGAAVAVDFSLPQCVAAHARACAAAGVPLLVGTTGFDSQARAELEAAARAVPVLIAPNTSVGVAVMAHLLKQATAALGPHYDVEIYEAHHRSKRDAPSGTALALGEAVAAARGERLADIAVFDRHGGFAPRQPGSIGFAVMRAGDIVGEHTVTFAAAGERLELTHRAADRSTFASGALRAAEWLIGRPAGIYGMHDVLGL